MQLRELNEAGQFTAVEVLSAKDVRTGGVFQLRQVYQRLISASRVKRVIRGDSCCLSQGQSRRVQVEVRSVPDSGTMPLIVASILSVSIGDVKVRQNRLSKGESQWVNCCQTEQNIHMI